MHHALSQAALQAAANHLHSCGASVQVVLSHTPYRELAMSLGDKPVLISGRGASEVASAYGFRRAVTTAQLSAKYPTAVPFCHEPGMTALQCCCLYEKAARLHRITSVSSISD